jgi:uncharacterized protein
MDAESSWHATEEEAMAGYFEIKKAADGRYMFALKADDGETILTSKSYLTRDFCDHGIAHVRRNAAVDARYARTITRLRGKFGFNLTAPNGQILGTSEEYDSESARDEGIESVKRTVPEATVEDVSGAA